MPLDISLILRKWAFDLDSEALGPIRIANADMQKIFNENEAAIRAGELEGTQLARVLFEKTAHKRTGDEAADKMCEGPTFERSELDLLTSSELDLFADTLIKSRLRFVIPKGVDAPKPTTETGCAALSGALIAFADADRASRAALAETWKKQFSAVDQIEAQWKQTQSIAAGLGLTKSIVEVERARAEKWKAIAGVESIANKTVRDWLRQDDQVRAAMEHLAGGGIAKAIEQFQRDADLAAIATGTIRPNLLGFVGMTAAERIGMASGHAGTIADYVRENGLAATTGSWVTDALSERDITLREFRPIPAFPPPPNPVQETNKIVGKLLDHQKEVAANSEAEMARARGEAQVAIVENKRMASSSLRYTKANFWGAAIFFLALFSWGVWIFFDAKEAAAMAKVEAESSAKRSERLINEQRAEIRGLTEALMKVGAPKPGAEQPAKKVQPQ